MDGRCSINRVKSFSNPNENRRSASSITSVSRLSFKWTFSAFSWLRILAGVETMISGRLESTSFWAATSVYEERSTHWTIFWHFEVSCSTTAWIWWHSSLLGAKISVDVICSVALSFEFSTFWITGMANAAVFPDPVRARTKTSFPSMSRGIADSCMRVGVNQPSFAIAWER